MLAMDQDNCKPDDAEAVMDLHLGYS